MNTKEIIIDHASKIENLRFRKFAGDSDFPEMWKIISAAAIVDKEENTTSLEDIKNNYAHLNNSDPEHGMVFAEVNGKAVAYSRVEWYQEEDPNHRIYQHFLNIDPEWRSKGIEEPITLWCENRLKTIAETHPQDSQRFLQTFSNEIKTDYNQLLEAIGYEAARYGFSMKRSLEDIPTAELPEGIEARPVQEADWRNVWDAANEAFRDHWGFVEPTEKDYQAYLGSKYFQPDLWQVAWDGDRVVASVMNYINHDHNQAFDQKVGWTENISTLKEYRRRGIARALIVRSMHMHKALGMTEVALGVDTNNPTGALRLYKSLGYQTTLTWITYRKPI